MWKNNDLNVLEKEWIENERNDNIVENYKKIKDWI